MSVSNELQHLVNNLQRGQSGAPTAATRQAAPQDRVPFVNPYSESMARMAVKDAMSYTQKGMAFVPAGQDNKRPNLSLDVNRYRQLGYLASEYMRRLGYRRATLHFILRSQEIKRFITAQIKKSKQEHDLERSKEALQEEFKEARYINEEEEQSGREETAAEGAEEEVSELPPRERDEETLEKYSPATRAILKFTEKQSKDVTEQFGMLQFTANSVEMDIEMYSRQIEKAKANLQHLRDQNNPKLSAKIDLRERQIAAMQSDLDTAQQIRTELAHLLGEMERIEGKKIRDGFNLIPKASKVIERFEPSWKLSSVNLAANYRDEVLNIGDPAEFFANFMRQHQKIGFKDYIKMMLQLLGDDMSSVNPTQNPNQLKAVRDALFETEISYQTFESFGLMDLRFDRLHFLREKEEGTYETHVLTLFFQPDYIEASSRGPSKKIESFAPVALSNEEAVDEALHDWVNEQRIDEILVVMPENFSEADKKKVQRYIRQWRVSYGLPIQRKIIDLATIQQAKADSEVPQNSQKNLPQSAYLQVGSPEEKKENSPVATYVLRNFIQQQAQSR